MFDSSAKYPYGIFDGLNRYLGSFDQCNRIETIVWNEKNDKFEKIRSKYCLVDIKYQKNTETTNFTGRKNNFAFDSQASAWEAVQETLNVGRYERNVLQIALCFPAKCRTNDIIAALKEPLKKFNEEYNLKIQATIRPEYCHANHEISKFSNYDKAYWYVV
ncbi:uncharacterized protein LOC122512923 [Leptopilina heterotoma]|uniref:uncharacterized protein LOC122512923 n=1 Tax=Leptopilina heterotoma TaxID=63436 RepID=UPI001CA86E7D|nr:uncharacterized protein LOC122512923 [Leptopilina heterotoma]